MVDDDLGAPQFEAHAVTEPIFIVCVMIAACYFNRRRGFSIIPSKQDQGLLGNAKLADDDVTEVSDSDEQEMQFLVPSEPVATLKRGPKKRDCCGTVIHTPNSARYANHWHSRFIQKFPFLVEMFYWVINLLFYVAVKGISAAIFSTEGVWEISQRHAINILYIEHESMFRFFFPVKEVAVQMWFRDGHQNLLTVLNRAYSLIHIPVTVSFLAWYYYAAPTHAQFAQARRMMTLTNLFSFVVFTTYPCMPPRLLPEEYGFYDTVRREDAESIWASGKFFNQLAAFPSLHFGYSFCIGTILFYHSGLFRRRLAHREKRMSRAWQIFFATISIVYPCFVLLIIVSTANHFYLDALAATGVVLACWLCNRLLLFLLPLEDLFLYCVKLEKPVPTTGYRQ